MCFSRKESQIKKWWIAQNDSKTVFSSITIGKSTSKNLIVVGLKVSGGLSVKFDLIHSPDYVVKVTKKGVVTQSGVRYDFNDAHPLYLKFLVESQEQDTLVVTNWEFVKYGIITAELPEGNGSKKEITFDFVPYKNAVLFTGYSKELKSKIILTPFTSKKDIASPKISESLIANIYNSSFVDETEKESLVKKLKE